MIKKQFLFAVALLAACVMTSCDKDDSPEVYIEDITVAPCKGMVIDGESGIGFPSFFFLKDGGASYDMQPTISGFNEIFVEGHVYQLKVRRKTTPVTICGYETELTSYSLVDVVSDREQNYIDMSVTVIDKASRFPGHKPVYRTRLAGGNVLDLESIEGFDEQYDSHYLYELIIRAEYDENLEKTDWRQWTNMNGPYRYSLVEIKKQTPYYD